MSDFNHWNLVAKFKVFVWYYVEIPKITDLLTVRKITVQNMSTYLDLVNKAKQERWLELTEAERWQMVEDAEKERTEKRGKRGRYCRKG